MQPEQLRSYFSEHRARILDEYFEFLRFKSISADPAYHDECVACAKWLGQKLAQLGFAVELVETSGKPVVVAERIGKKGAPRIMYYGHYDVQPADPVDLWESDPFEPELRDGRVYARGALDNKGQTFYFVKALEALLAADALDASLTLVVEGEEETGSAGISEVLPQLKQRLAADVLLVCDTDYYRAGIPTIVMGLRGVATIEICIAGPNRDLHSGLNGGLCRNPAVEMARLIDSFFEPSGRIAIEGYYEGVRPPTAEEQQYLERLGFSEEEYKKENGVLPDGGEQGLSPLERIGFNPTLEVNGLYSGYTGAGGKTIIPSKATVKISTRVAGAQDPARCLELIQAHCKKHVPASLSLSFSHVGVGGPAFFMNAASPYVQQAREILHELFETEPVLLWEGASIPIVSNLVELTGGEALMIGFGLGSDNIHAPNESFALSRFEEGFLYVATALQKLRTATAAT